MKKMNIVLGALLLATAGGAFAADDMSNTTREQRMDRALTDYRSKGTSGTGAMSSGSARSNSTSSGSMAKEPGPKVGNSFGSNMKAAGRQMKEGGKEAGHAVAQGARKTGHAVHKGANKAVNMTKDKPAP